MEMLLLIYQTQPKLYSEHQAMPDLLTYKLKIENGKLKVIKFAALIYTRYNAS